MYTSTRWKYYHCHPFLSPLGVVKKTYSNFCKLPGQRRGQYWRCSCAGCYCIIDRSGGELIKQWHDWWDRNGRQFNASLSSSFTRKKSHFSWWSLNWAKRWNVYHSCLTNHVIVTVLLNLLLCWHSRELTEVFSNRFLRAKHSSFFFFCLANQPQTLFFGWKIFVQLLSKS